MPMQPDLMRAGGRAVMGEGESESEGEGESAWSWSWAWDCVGRDSARQVAVRLS